MALTRPHASQIAYRERFLDERLDDNLNAKDVGALGDGTTDDAAAILAALAESGDVSLPAGTFRLTSTITIANGQRLRGAGKNATILLIDHVDGPGVVLAGAQAELADLQVKASTSRAAEATSGYALISGLFGVKVYNASGTLTQCRVSRVLSRGHPNHGFYMGGPGAGTVFDQCESYYNRGHGYAFDDRTIGGGTSERCGIVSLTNCRALDNGGNAVNLSQAGSTCYRFLIDNLETLWNAWNTDIPSLVNAELYLAGENHKVVTPAFGDLDGDSRTTMGDGRARLAKTTLSEGMFLRSGTNGVIVELPRFISTSKGLRAGTGVVWLRVFGAYFTKQETAGGDIQQTIGFDIGNNCADLFLDVPATSDAVATMVASNAYKDYPMVVNKALSSDYTITGTAAYESVTGLEETVYLPAGLYRFTLSMTIENGDTDSQYSVAPLLTNTGDSSDTALGASAHGTIAAADFGTLNLSFVYRVTTAGSYTVKSRVRQQTGSAGKVLKSDATFGNTRVQVERVR